MTLSNIFKDRNEAGEKLAELLSEFKDSNAIVLALPRGGVAVGAAVAKNLHLPLDIIVTRKISASGNPEYAIGAIDIDGNVIWSEDEVINIDRRWLDQEIAREKEEAARRWQTYRGLRDKLTLRGKIAIIVDDGMATGLTMQAAVRYAKKLGAHKIIVAVPIASLSAMTKLKTEAEVRALKIPEPFFSVGQFYADFPQMEDAEVVEILARKHPF